MSTQEAVTQIKSLKREFNRLRKFEGRAYDESLLFWYNQKLDTAIAAISSDDLPEAKSVLNKLKADFDHRAKFMQEAKDYLEQTPSMKESYDNAAQTQKEFQTYSSKVKAVLAAF
jgi:hypothetical protein